MTSLPIDWWFYFDDEPSAREAASALAEDGCIASIDVPVRYEGAEDWLLRAYGVLDDDDQFGSVRDRLEALAERFGGRYDGWEITVPCGDGQAA